jgi:eukaryotic-like serine/threonine-protein kinase
MRLRQKILLFTGTLVLAITGGTLVFTDRQADSLARAALRQSLLETREVWQTLQADRFDKLRLGIRVLANDPPFKAAVVETDQATAFDTMRERGRDLDAGFVLATDARGRLLARSDRAGASGDDLSAEAIVGRALDGEESATLWRRQGEVFTAVAVPMTIGPELAGVLVAGYRLDDEVATQVRKLTRSEIAILVRQEQGEPRLTASSLGGRASDLSATLAAIAGVPGDEPRDVDLAGEDQVVLRLPLKTATGEEIGSVLALRSVASETALFRRFRSNLLAVSLGVVLVALMLAWFAATRVTRPLRALVGAVERVREGSYTGALAVPSGDEVGVLARAFNGLVADLRQRDEVISFLRGASGEAGQITGTIPTLRPETGTLPLPAPGRSHTGGLLEAGALFASRYEILETLGRGGMGVVYRAHDRQLDDTVALKLVLARALAADPSLGERLKQELKLARRITHRNVVRTHDLGEADGVPYISMEYVSGVTLKQLVGRRGPLPLAVGLSVAKQLAHGLGAAHEQGVVHRDVKSHNVLIIPETGEIKVMDFGIARTTAMDADSGLTGAGMLVGTPDYMAPEQVQGRPADARSDLYSLCVVLFEAFTGRLPFRAATVLEVMTAHVQTPPPSPLGLDPRLPSALDALILRGLAKDPARRWQSTDELLDALSAVPEAVAAA